MQRKGFSSGFRSLVVGVNTKVPLENGKHVTAINFDNAATTPPFVSVMREINKFAPWYSSIHRGTGYKSQLSSDIYEDSRKEVLDFVKADADYYTVIYVKNTTEAINKLSYRLYHNLKKGVILSTQMEHHSNDLPWRDKYCVRYLHTDRLGRISLKDLERKLRKYRGRVKLVALTGVSNVTGYINPIYQAAALAHKYKARILVDGAQLVPHCPVEMKQVGSPENIDFLVFSAHKMYAPFGVGVIIGPKKYFKKGGPEYMGGGTVKLVTLNKVIWDDAPHKEEAGTVNLMGVVALLAAMRTIKNIGIDQINRFERSLTDYALEKMRRIPDLKIYGDAENTGDKVGIIPFNIKGIPHQVVAQVLSQEGGIAVRNGCFCAQPYIQKLLCLSRNDIKRYIKDTQMLRPGMVRISFGLYNHFSEIDTLENMLRYIVENKEELIQKYQSMQAEST
ncbi:aminotransferase class V-fold PLP-dependent enzyme [Candidatus Formimonas warabiya]|uniref:Class V aminotransferase n=1 Tax=Formimonas warabiya TaxID=1761012 RepID=A0A3G1KN33_FORW1|nr:aminotransferase class V-fold PLP-dependent enzyme [Candidatus Formimonas warabiya]ATW23830.1 class V aminotransferase [Candidatus Formimonas warabiya]